MSLWTGFVVHPELLWGTALVLGLLIGSFLNVVILRLPPVLEHQWRGQCHTLLQTGTMDAPLGFDLAKPGSRCPHCQHALAAWENIPVLSFVALRGRCRACRKPISLRYPAVELLAGLLSLAVAHHFGASRSLVPALVLTWTLIALAGIDLDRQILPDILTLPLLWLGLALNRGALFASPVSAITGALWGYLSLWLLFHAFRALTGKEGMGHGDFKLLAALGAWLGWIALPVIVLIASLAGAVIGIGLILKGRLGREVPMPFGPFLAAAGWIALMWRNPLVAAYIHLMH